MDYKNQQQGGYYSQGPPPPQNAYYHQQQQQQQQPYYPPPQDQRQNQGKLYQITINFLWFDQNNIVLTLCSLNSSNHQDIINLNSQCITINNSHHNNRKPLAAAWAAVWHGKFLRYKTLMMRSVTMLSAVSRVSFAVVWHKSVAPCLFKLIWLHYDRCNCAKRSEISLLFLFLDITFQIKW